WDPQAGCPWRPLSSHAYVYMGCWGIPGRHLLRARRCSTGSTTRRKMTTAAASCRSSRRPAPPSPSSPSSRLPLSRPSTTTLRPSCQEMLTELHCHQWPDDHHGRRLLRLIRSVPRQCHLLSPAPGHSHHPHRAVQQADGVLALDPTLANYCLSDVQQLLMSQGASDDLHSICSVHLSNATEGSCPVSTVDAFESVVDSSKLLEACRKVDPVNECCSQTCQSAISDAARKISSKDAALTSDTASPKVNSCRNVVLRWLSSRLEPSSATKMLRQISNCNVNGVCPLSFPDTSKVAKECGGTVKNITVCCKAMDSYVSHLQKQSFITNLQALNCASVLGAKLQEMKVSTNVYSSCQVTLKDFSLQVGSQESGCLLPTAPWSPSLQASASTCNKSAAPGPTIPERPAATSAQNGVNHNRLELSLAVCFGALVATILLQV
ncbi:hypothetical protein CFC21_016916, partial [Triticum aestivum]